MDVSGQGRSSAMKMKVGVGAVWPGQALRAGDILAFNYLSGGAHNVVAVNKDGYNKCSNAKRRQSVQQRG
ncbi:hypothetical protein HAX54_017646 [Datura stramonium]|uniref:Phytocyanin domain-containing protein n=1 Tax=Datura stramonium TaxID=4076 RepID=A0ABS8UN40_DATST|nr:hypothetical protein [Datura stramonium]